MKIVNTRANSEDTIGIWAQQDQNATHTLINEWDAYVVHVLHDVSE